MKRIKKLIEEIEKQKNKISLQQTMKSLEDEINLLILHVKDLENVESALHYFESLDQIQFELAKLLFIEKIELSTGLRKFVRDFDRIDDYNWRNQLFQKIKNGVYILN